MPESLMVIRSSSTLRKHWEWMTFSADSVSSVHTLTDDLPLESLADQPGAGNVHLLIPPEGLLYRSLTLPNAKYKLTALNITMAGRGDVTRQHPGLATGRLSINKTKVSR